MSTRDDVQTERRPISPSARSSARLGLGQVDVLAPGLLHVRFAGSLRLEHLEPMMYGVADEICKGNRVVLAIDADDVHAYKSEVRKIFQTWLRDIQPDLEATWMLYRSPVMKMGISLMNSFTGGLIRSFSDPEQFDAELTRATHRARAHRAGRPLGVVGESAALLRRD